MSSIVFSKIIKTNLNKYKVQQFQFKNSTYCTAHYNQLVKKYAEEASNEFDSYNLNDWTSNYFIINHKALCICRFGSIIQITQSKQFINLLQFKDEYSQIHNQIKK